MTVPKQFIEVGHCQERKGTQAACGDVFLSQKVDRDHRVISVLADGLGSGIKASILANLTATMALRYMANNVDLQRAAATIMATLPVCSERQIAYSTFTIVDMDRWGATRVVEYDNPPFLLLRNGAPVAVEAEIIPLRNAGGREEVLRHSRFTAQPGDRIIVCSDGVSQAGVGAQATPLGWGMAAATAFLQQVVKDRPRISARQLARTLVQRAMAQDGHTAKDDITCGIITFRKPREVLVLTGAPVAKARDPELAEAARAFEGHKVICGGTTAAILSRELGLKLRMDTTDLNEAVPPASIMEGFELVTEGALTLSTVSRLLEEEDNPDLLVPNAATRLASVLLDSDIIHILAGTKINEAMQDPSLPVDLDIRRNILRRLQRVLSEKHLKEVRLRFI
jgi:serine/threonine protein phosphatase PrpC